MMFLRGEFCDLTGILIISSPSTTICIFYNNLIRLLRSMLRTHFSDKSTWVVVQYFCAPRAQIHLLPKSGSSAWVSHKGPNFWTCKENIRGLVETVNKILAWSSIMKNTVKVCVFFWRSSVTKRKVKMASLSINYWQSSKFGFRTTLRRVNNNNICSGTPH